MTLQAVSPTSDTMRILLIEDDKEAAAYLQKAFRESGHVPDHAADGETGLHMAENQGYDVLVVDRMLPQRDGLSVISALREKGDMTPALILSALGQVDDRVTGLRAGGDDYLAKPYAFSELLARVEVLGRRRATKEIETVYRVGDLELDRLSHEVKRGGRTITLCRDLRQHRQHHRLGLARAGSRGHNARVAVECSLLEHLQLMSVRRVCANDSSILADATFEEAGQDEITLDLFLANELAKVFARGLAFQKNAVRAGLAETLDQRLASRADAPARHAAVPARCRLAQRLAVEELDASPGPRQFDGCRQASIATTHDGHVAGRFDSSDRQGCEGAIFPPEGCGFRHVRRRLCHERRSWRGERSDGRQVSRGRPRACGSSRSRARRR